MPFKSDFNRLLIFVEILSILGWTAGTFGMGIVYLIHFDVIFEYKYVLTITILEWIQINANFINFSIMWLIFY